MIKYKYYSRYDDDELRVLDEITRAGFDMDLETYLSYVLKQLLFRVIKAAKEPQKRR